MNHCGNIRHGSLFSGIGGFDLAAGWLGWENVFHCEISAFCNRVLHYYWPKAVTIEDINDYEWKKWKGKIDVLSGGFPCQPFSLAGKRAGTKDARYLWPEMFSAIQQIQPGWVVAENVYGLINWHEGVVFEQVQAELEAEGYQVQAYVLPAAGVGAPHRRDRVWIVAYCDRFFRNGQQSKTNERSECVQKGTTLRDHAKSNAGKRYAAHANSRKRSQGRLHTPGSPVAKCHARARHSRLSRNPWKNFPSQPAICPGNDGFSGELDGITFSKWRTESIRAAGNAIVPQVALQLFRAIQTILSEK